jgi:hypothetical protein
MRADGPVIALALCAIGCRNTTQVTVLVDPPSDHGCIGVAGFDVDIAGGQGSKQQTVLRTAPVLADEDCRIPSAVSLDGLDPEAPVDITINGYDDLRELRVSGSAHLDGLDPAAPTRLLLVSAAAAAARPVLALDRAVAFPGIDLSTVTSINIHTQKGNLDLVTATIDEPTAPFFSVGEPGAFTLKQTPAEGEDIAVVLKAPGGNSSPAQLTVSTSANGLYWETRPR